MKGFMIYETPLWGDEENTVYLQEVNDASYTLKLVDSDGIACYLEGIATNEPVTKATCSKEDTYDFEMGALIALMKKCGAKKVAEACCEAFPHETSGSIYRENKKYIKQNKKYIKRIKELEEKVDNLYTYNKNLINDIDQKNHEIISLKALKLTNESLKKDNESFRKSLEKLREENKSAQSAYEIMVEKSADLMDKVKKLEEENKELKKQKEQIIVAKNVLYNNLREENEKLKTDCEKLQHGYNDTDMIFCGGRQNGKQYKALVELFKKLDQKKVDAAYKETYNTTLPVWQKEVLNQLYGISIRKESKDKTELPIILDINGITIQIKPQEDVK